MNLTFLIGGANWGGTFKERTVTPTKRFALFSPTLSTMRHSIFSHQLQLNPAMAHFKGLAKIMVYTEVFTTVKIQITMKILHGAKI